ncbi:hypothetical protein J6590_018316 [Homalodisca vitripennis]|nr:hypothetical protein J6590_018316 [Homalodisca vitripennis]
MRQGVGTPQAQHVCISIAVLRRTFCQNFSRKVDRSPNRVASQSYLPSSSSTLGGEEGAAGGGGEQGGDLESSGSTTGDTEPRLEGPESGQESGPERGPGPSNCLVTNCVSCSICGHPPAARRRRTRRGRKKQGSVQQSPIAVFERVIRSTLFSRFVLEDHLNDKTHLNVRNDDFDYLRIVV